MQNRSGEEVMLPLEEREHAAYDPARECEWCGRKIPKERQENALFIGRYPKYHHDICAKRAANARYYASRGRPLLQYKKRLRKQRRKRRKKRQ